MEDRNSNEILISIFTQMFYIVHGSIGTTNDNNIVLSYSNFPIQNTFKIFYFSIINI